MKQFTKGPWSVDRWDEDNVSLMGYYESERGKTKIRIADIYCTTDDDGDAYLIASAPDMYEALKTAVQSEADRWFIPLDSLLTAPVCPEWVKQAVRVLAKAEGR